MRRRLALAWAAIWLAPVARAAEARLAAPNVVPITPHLVTSGQPTADSLATLGQLGFEAVIYLAPLSVPDAVAAEPELLARQHIEFLNVPIAFDQPSAADVEAVANVLDRWRDKKVLVHCQVNMRASSMVFLYRVLRLKEPPERAYEAVEQVWSPRGAWRRLIVEQLREHGIAFEPY
ncbi:protein tyrosine phosphatase family protein [Ideonella sp.]|uniref:protein tyrosine phosphatase family protein n=1 Tax=Ideonella sp. TaxID=1929293 RepID=UPI002B46DC07|nr:protein tyrosine phosphatase family protein [Ideonella sp.]HJV67638.1 protein tyrosine phosphatase family protein [Ideonella sp.]